MTSWKCQAWLWLTCKTKWHRKVFHHQSVKARKIYEHLTGSWDIYRILIHQRMTECLTFTTTFFLKWLSSPFGLSTNLGCGRVWYISNLATSHVHFSQRYLWCWFACMVANHRQVGGLRYFSITPRPSCPPWPPKKNRYLKHTPTSSHMRDDQTVRQATRVPEWFYK